MTECDGLLLCHIWTLTSEECLFRQICVLVLLMVSNKYEVYYKELAWENTITIILSSGQDPSGFWRICHYREQAWALSKNYQGKKCSVIGCLKLLSKVLRQEWFGLIGFGLVWMELISSINNTVNHNKLHLKNFLPNLINCHEVLITWSSKTVNLTTKVKLTSSKFKIFLNTIFIW